MFSICVPFRGGDPNRDAAWAWLQARYEAIFPGAELIVADDGGNPFSRAASLNEAASMATGEVLALIDADVLVPRLQIVAAIEAAQVAPGLVFPFTRYLAIRSEPTQTVLQTEPYIWPTLSPEGAWMDTDACLGAAVICSRETFELAGGFDPRFRGWGFEDVAFAIAAGHLAGEIRRISGTLWHLYHPSAVNHEAEDYRLNQALEQRYEEAGPSGIKALLDERMATR